ncbi:MAG: relaxase domain-containing protein [Opitutaceae bacterium]|nr:relaxase domain-containing protein [Opitutaceae bacterium]
MLTIRTCKIFSKALGEYLRQADYYAEGMKVEGTCCGRLCAAVGLTEGIAISDEAFGRIASNHHAGTGEQLTERMKEGRRAGYDAVFNAPKSVSIQAFLGGDERLILAHERAVNEALQELETSACHQDGQGMNKRYVTSGKIAAAVFRHGESRALDPHLHSHAFIFNVTQNDSGRLLALESSVIFERTKYLTEVYRNVLAREIHRLGYAIERRNHGFELAGITSELLSRFSKRAQQRDAAIAAREAELGRELTRDEIAVLVRENRAKKQHELTPAEVRGRQLAQVDVEELAWLRALRPTIRPRWERSLTLGETLTRAIAHTFERRTVVPLHELTAELIRQSYGQYSLRDLKETIARGPGLLHADGQVSTVAALEMEQSLVAQINAGVGAGEALGHARADQLAPLSAEQRTAVSALLNSTDRVTVFRGRAGTGKTHTLATAIEGLATAGREIVCFAPSTQAVEILKRDGLEQAHSGRLTAAQALGGADTVQRLLVDPARQAGISEKVVIVDEYGLLSTWQLTALVDLTETHRARLVLVGDSAQHKSVEAGDAGRIVEKESRATIAELREVKRQSANPAYRAAAEALAAGRINEGLTQLDKMGAIIEIEHPTARRVKMVEEWHTASQETKFLRTRDGVQERAKTALMVAPTWVEIDALNTHAREKLRSAGQLVGEDLPFIPLRAKDWTKAQQRDYRNYQPGDILVAHKATKHIAKGDELRVIRREKHRIVVARGAEPFSVSPRQSGLVWTVCEERPSLVATGDRMRLRSVAQIRTPQGNVRRLANGTSVIVQSVDSSGRLVLANGATLLSRQVVHGYALTSHAAQGLTVDRVFIAGAISREGLYVSATRGREGIRIFVPDRTAFLNAAGLRTESRVSAIEFVRKHPIQTGLRATLARGWRHLQHIRALSTIRATAMTPGATQVRPPAAIVAPPKPGVRIVDIDSSPLPEPPRERMRIRL